MVEWGCNMVCVYIYYIVMTMYIYIYYNGDISRHTHFFRIPADRGCLEGKETRGNKGEPGTLENLEKLEQLLKRYGFSKLHF